MICEGCGEIMKFEMFYMIDFDFEFVGWKLVGFGILEYDILWVEMNDNNVFVLFDGDEGLMVSDLE